MPLPSEADRRRPGYRLANAVSYVFNPLVLPPIGFGLVQRHFGADAPEIARTVVITVCFFCVVPLTYIVWMVRHGEAESLEVRSQHRRLRPFLVGIGAYAAGLAVLALTVETATSLLVSMAALFPLNTLVILLINLRWKISVHLTSLAGFVSVLLFVAFAAWRGPPEGGLLTVGGIAPLLLLVPLMMWARVRVCAHTLGQALAGTLFGLLVPFAELYGLAYGVLDLAGRG